ncbi:MAG: sialidase family protein [Kiritimatiellae bacterium]|nr:sialidase family protein [Kiritimatiellia bacterium]
MLSEKRPESPHILFVTQNTPFLIGPTDVPQGQVWRYGLGFPFQVAPRLAGLICNIRGEGLGMADAEVGLDVMLFDKIMEGARASAAIPIARMNEMPAGQTDKLQVVLKYPGSVGFVPLGAKRADGSPHPHAGTGFCLVISVVYQSDRLNPAGASSGVSPIHGVVDSWCEMLQLAFDGNKIAITGAEKIDLKHRPAACAVARGGMSAGFGDGDDLLMACCTGSGGVMSKDAHVPGVVRWKHDRKGWYPAEFFPAGSDNWCEPSLTRDKDGTLLFSSRSYRTGLAPLFALWRSTDKGQTWARCFEADYGRTECPLSINRAADGTPYFAANARINPDLWSFSPELREKGGGQKFGRARLSIWELNGRRTGLLAPRVVRDFFDSPDFRIGSEASYWRADHPVGNVVQLADGRWHSLLAYRVIYREKHESSGKPRPQTGLYLEELVCETEGIPEWRF